MTTRKIPKKPPLAEVSIIDRQDQTEDLTLMWIEKPEGYQFKPGQYCTIGHDGVERAYSIASSPHEKYIELFIIRDLIKFSLLFQGVFSKCTVMNPISIMMKGI